MPHNCAQNAIYSVPTNFNINCNRFDIFLINISKRYIYYLIANFLEEAALLLALVFLPHQKNSQFLVFSFFAWPSPEL